MRTGCRCYDMHTYTEAWKGLEPVYLFQSNEELEIDSSNWHSTLFKSQKLYSWFAKRCFFEVLEWEGGKRKTQLTLLPTARGKKVISFTDLVYKQFYF